MIKIIVVGGGAGGLELATKLGRKLGKKGKAEVTLVDRNTSHLWKPLLHEVATGSMDAGVDALSYRAHGKNHGFRFRIGALKDIDRDNKEIVLDAAYDDSGELVLPERRLSYDILVVALGSVSNHFNTPGVREHCIFLDSPTQAHRFHKKMIDTFLQYNNGLKEGKQVNVAIVGGGATGVELSAELYNTVEQLASYGFEKVSRESLKVTLVEAGERILPALPVRISSAAHNELTKLGVDVRVATMVTEATKQGLHTKDGDFIEADLMVWAAGIKAPDFMKEIGGLETNRINQLVVEPTLVTTRDESIYAIGDCACCPQADGSFVPPRAQSAHQMATTAYKNILASLANKKQRDYVYHDHGSLVSLSKFSTVGSLMGNLMRGSMKVEGRLARLVYISLYRMHQLALHGWFKTMLMTVVGRINRVLRPTLKLH